MRFKCLWCGTEFEAEMIVKCPRCGHKGRPDLYLSICPKTDGR